MRLVITPPIPKMRGALITGIPGQPVTVQKKVKGEWKAHVKGLTGEPGPEGGVFHFNASSSKYRAKVDGGDWVYAHATAANRKFADPFVTLDATKWSTRGTAYLPGNSDSVRADPSAAVVQDGRLKLRVLHDPDGQTSDSYLTGHIGTKGKFEFTYGWAAARMKFHELKGAHGCFWLQTTTDYLPGQAEIDVAEFFGDDPTYKNPLRNDRVWHSVYWRDHIDQVELGMMNAQTYVGDAQDWHTYAVQWYPEGYDFWVDGIYSHTLTGGLSDQPKFLVLSMLVRNWELDDISGQSLDSYETQVEWVRVWQ